MKKYNLPAILLRGLVLLPHNTMKLEFDEKNVGNSVIDMAELFHDNHILVVSDYTKNQIPNIGVVSKIINKIELPNGNTRMDIIGLRRVEVVEYLNITKTKDPLESIVCEIEEEDIHEKEEAILNKLNKELREYVRSIPYSSNSILTQIASITSLSEYTDVVAPTLNTSMEKLSEYLKATDVIERSEMLLKDIYQESEMFKIERNIDLKVKKELDDSQKEFLLREKIKLIKEELGDTSKEDEIEILRERIDKLDCKSSIKDRLYLELNRYSSCVSASPEVNIIRDYMEWLLELPWNIYTSDNENLKDVRKKLDASHYGLETVKERIIEYLAVAKVKKSLNGPIICLVGPPGVGKTSLAYSIASSMNRNFVKMAVGGVRDESEIIGHRRTYVGASPGRIIRSIKQAKSCNPVFLIDEIDKMSSDYKGDPTSCLLSVLDPEQNKYFSDNYIEEEFDLSNVMFILTANYLENIPEPLMDRLEIIHLSGYTEYEKLDIAQKHLLPKICRQNGLDLQYLTIPEDVILTIIRKYTKEAGVRELERQLSKIIRKIVTQMVVNNIKINKVNITLEVLEKYLGKPKYHYGKTSKKSQVGVVNGLAYTTYGGDLLPIEVTFYQGTGKLVLTGSLGDVMKESASIALSYIKANYQKFGIDYNQLLQNDIHIHVPEGAIPKEGPSAGIALTLALVSALTGKRIPKTIALTGEITLRGHVLAIGGLKEKSIGALRGNVKTIFIPYDNKRDLEELPKEVRESISFVPVKDFMDVWKKIGKNE